MKSNDELSYFDDNQHWRFWFKYFDRWKNIWYNLVYNISYKTVIGAKPLHIQFSKVDGFISLWWD